MIVEVHYSQSRDSAGRQTGPVMWRCDRLGVAGRTFFDIVADEDLVAFGLSHSYPAAYVHILDAHRAGGDVRVMNYNTETLSVSKIEADD